MIEHKSVHEYFGLTHANYLVMHRTLLEAMPVEWQENFVRLLDEYDTAWDHIDPGPTYRVQTGRWVYVEDLSFRELDRLGIVTSMQLWLERNPEPKPENFENEDDYAAVYEPWSDRRDAQFDIFEYIDDEGNGNVVSNTQIFLPTSDTVDHYRHPRKYTPLGNSAE